MIAAELVDPATQAPDPVLTGKLAKYAHSKGVVMLTAGTFGNILRFLPPLTITDDLLNEGLDVLADAFEAIEG